MSYAATVDEVREKVAQYYYGEIDGKLEDAKSIEELMGMLDEFSVYYTKEEYLANYNAIDLKAVGIGVTLEEVESGLKVIKVVTGAPADQMGIIVGDIITHVDNISLKGKSSNEGASYIIGESGTADELTMTRKDGTVWQQTLIRKFFEAPNVEYHLLYGKIGYISLASFSSDASFLVLEALSKLMQQGATAFIFDLQNNGGGFTDSGSRIAGFFPGVQYSHLVKTKEKDYMLEAITQQLQFPRNTKVLVNHMSASASEMIAATLKDYGAAQIYGTKTYGKGTTQNYFQFEDGSYLKLRIGQFTGGKGLKINKIGVTPDVEVKENAVAKAHLDLLNEEMSKSFKIAPFSISGELSQFSPIMKAAFDYSENVELVELVELGGQRVLAKVNQLGSTIAIRYFKKPQLGKEYIISIIPMGTEKNSF